MKNIIIIIVIIHSFNIYGQRKGLNVIELRNNNENSDSYIYATYRVAPEDVEFKYYFSKGEWKNISHNSHGTEYNTDILWGVSMEFEKPDTLNRYGYPIFYLPRTTPPREFPAFNNPCQRDTKNCGISHKFGNHKNDWDFLNHFLDSLLSVNNLSRNSDEWKIIKVIGDWATDHRGISREVHPVDYIDSTSMCIGAANTVIALASILGIPARNVDTPFHGACEVFVNGKWRFLENTPYRTEAIGSLQKINFNKLLMDPHSAGLGIDDHYLEVTNHVTIGRQRTYHYAFDGYSHWRFHWMGNYDQPYWDIDMVANSTYELSILYPNRDTIYYKGLPDNYQVWLTPVKKVKGDIRIDSKNALRRYFDVPTLRGVKKVSSQLMLSEENASSILRNGGDWYFLINGKQFNLKEYEGWKIMNDHPLSGKPYISFDLPMELLNFADEHLNYPPTLNSIDNPSPVNINEKRRTIKLTGITDGDPKKSQNISIQSFCNPKDIITEPKISYKQGDSEASVSFKPIKQGVTTVTIEVTDDGGLSHESDNSTSKSFEIPVYDGNKTKIKYYPTNDSYIRYGGYARKNYRNADSLVVSKTNQSYFTYETYLKFDITDTPYPIKTVIKLKGSANKKTLIGIFGSSDDNWSETNLKANNQPVGFKLLDSTIIEGTGTFEWDVSRYVQKQKDGTLTFKFASLKSDSSICIFRSKEDLNSYPFMEITTCANEVTEKNQVLIPVKDDIYIQKEKFANEVSQEIIKIKTGKDFCNGYKDKNSAIGFLRFSLNDIPDDYDSVFLSLTVKDGDVQSTNPEILNTPVKLSIVKIPSSVNWNETTMDYEFAKVLWSYPNSCGCQLFRDKLNYNNLIKYFIVEKVGNTYKIEITDLIRNHLDSGNKYLSLAIFEKDRDSDAKSVGKRCRGEGNVISTHTEVNFYSKDAPGISLDKKPLLIFSNDSSHEM